MGILLHIVYNIQDVFSTVSPVQWLGCLRIYTVANSVA